MTQHLAEYCTQSSDIPPLHHTIVGYIYGVFAEKQGVNSYIAYSVELKAGEIEFGDTSKLPLYHRSMDHSSLFSFNFNIGIHKNKKSIPVGCVPPACKLYVLQWPPPDVALG